MSRRIRAGFTLVELLMVITIIGILAALSTAAIWKAIGTAKEAATVFELSQLDTAMKAYKEQAGQYPPDFSDYLYSSNTPPARQQRFNSHIKFAFPRASFAYSTLNSYLTTGNASYMYNFNPSANTGGGGGGSMQKLNLDNMDQAEALVFWLGGFPTPYSQTTGAPMGSRKLYGFNTNATNPFVLTQPTSAIPLSMLNQYRTQPKFDFDETRLVDNDQDGWLEYVPKLDPSSNGMIPPYVYFDSGAYTQWSTTTPPYFGYPAPLNNAPNRQTATQLMSAFGLAVPYATLVTPQSPMQTQWLNPISFQIISAGRDGQYGSQNMRVPMYPSGTTYTLPGFSNPGFYDSAETDNLTNFSPGQLQDQAGS